MRICILNPDGGTGKSALAFALGIEFDYYYLGNEDNVIATIYPKGYAQICKPEDMKIYDDAIYDFAGTIEAGTLDIVKECDIVIIPCINDLNSQAKAVKTIKSLQGSCDNFLVVATKLMKTKDFGEIQKAIHDDFPNMTVIASRYTDLYKNSLEFGKSPLELIRDSKLMAKNNINFIEEYKNILKYLLNIKEYKDLIKEKKK
jgi:cellulose biosynthesis protein BcsQ